MDHGITKGGESESRHDVNKMKKFEGQLYIDWGRERNMDGSKLSNLGEVIMSFTVLMNIRRADLKDKGIKDKLYSTS